MVVPSLIAGTALAAKRKALDPDASARWQEQERAARKACLNGDPNKGVSILSDLFVDSENPTYIYNQGRCLEQNARYADAAVRFEEYLRVADASLSAEDRTAAEKHLATCRERVAEERRAAAPPTPPPFVQPSPNPSPASSPALVAVGPQAAPTSGRHLLTAGIITASVGVAVIVGGVVLATKANGMVDDMQNQIGGYSTRKADDVDTSRTLAYVGYGVGAACVAAGGVLMGLGIKARTKPSTEAVTNVALVPAIGVGQVGAALTGGF